MEVHRGHSALRANLRSLPALHPDVVQHVFAVQDPQGATVIPLDHRLRCCLVSKAWRAVLDPRALPVAELCLDSQADAARTLAVTEWACRVQPNVEAATLSLIHNPSPQLVQGAYDALRALQPRTVSERTPKSQ